MSVESEQVVNLIVLCTFSVFFQQISLVTIVEIQTKKEKANLRLKLYIIVVGSSAVEELDPPEHEGDETDGHHGQVQHVEAAPAEAAGVEQEPVRDYFEQTLDCKYCCKEVVEVVEYLKK